MATAARDALLAEFDHEIATTKKLLERLPEKMTEVAASPGAAPEVNVAWRPRDAHREYPDVVRRHSQRGILRSPVAPPPLEALASRGEILTLFFESSATARKAMDKSDAEYAAMWTLKRGGQEVFSMPRIAVFRSFVLSHLIHHRGQLSVYLRLNDIAVPAIYGPSADEGQ